MIQNSAPSTIMWRQCDIQIDKIVNKVSLLNRNILVGHLPAFYMDSEGLINALHKVYVVDYYYIYDMRGLLSSVKFSIIISTDKYEGKRGKCLLLLL